MKNSIKFQKSRRTGSRHYSFFGGEYFFFLTVEYNFFYRLGKLEEAKEMFTKCLRINCQFSDAFISRGNIYMDYVSEAETVLAR